MDMNTQGELSERHSVASESGSSTDSHAETPDGELLLIMSTPSYQNPHQILLRFRVVVITRSNMVSGFYLFSPQ